MHLSEMLLQMSVLPYMICIHLSILSNGVSLYACIYRHLADTANRKVILNTAVVACASAHLLLAPSELASVETFAS